MATVIRFARHGTKKRPYFRIVVQDHHAPRDGKFIEHIGAYNPISGPASFTIKRDRLEYWLSCGAQMSGSVKNRLRVHKKAAPPSQPLPTHPKKKKDQPTSEVKASA